jgi:annexin A7/11
MDPQDNFPPKIIKLVGNPTVIKHEKYDVASDVKLLHNALGFFTKKSKLVEVLCTKPNRQRIQIVKAFKTCYDRDLVEDVKRKLRGDFRDLLVALLTPTKEYYCRELFEALNGAGTDEDVLIQIFVTLSNREIEEIKQKYLKDFGKSLDKDLREDTSGNFRKLLLSLSNGTRDESNDLDHYTARIDALELKRAGVDKWGTDASTFNRILCLRNFEQLKLIAKKYEFVTGQTLEKDIKKEFSGDIEDGLHAIVRVTLNRPEYFARCLYKTMAGFGTNEKSLNRLVITRSEIDMVDIKEAFLTKYGKTLKSFIIGDTSGYYRKALLKLIDE